MDCILSTLKQVTSFHEKQRRVAIFLVVSDNGLYI